MHPHLPKLLFLLLACAAATAAAGQALKQPRPDLFTSGQPSAQQLRDAARSAVTTVIRLGDLSRLRVRTEDLGEGDVNLVRVGQPVRVSIDALPELTFQGTVASIAPFASERLGDKVYDVLIDLDLPADSGLRWGMGTFVEIQVK